MKNEFISKLEEDEKLLWDGVSDVSKTSKQYGRFLLGFAVLLLFWILLMLGMNREKILNIRFLILFIVLSILTICFIYGFIYNVFLKYKNKNNEFFVTNKRIALYHPKRGFRIESISNIEHIGIAREKNNYGDLSFHFRSNNLTEQMKTGMSFEGVENPRKVVELICEINNEIHVYDDKPIIMGESL